MPTDPEDPELLIESTQLSFKKARDLVGDLKTVEELEQMVLGNSRDPVLEEEEPPLFTPPASRRN